MLQVRNLVSLYLEMADDINGDIKPPDYKGHKQTSTKLTLYRMQFRFNQYKKTMLPNLVAENRKIFNLPLQVHPISSPVRSHPVKMDKRSLEASSLSIALQL